MSSELRSTEILDSICSTLRPYRVTDGPAPGYHRAFARSAGSALHRLGRADSEWIDKGATSDLELFCSTTLADHEDALAEFLGGVEVASGGVAAAAQKVGAWLCNETLAVCDPAAVAAARAAHAAAVTRRIARRAAKDAARDAKAAADAAPPPAEASRDAGDEAAPKAEAEPPPAAAAAAEAEEEAEKLRDL